MQQFIAAEFLILYGLVCLWIYYDCGYPWERQSGDTWQLAVVSIPTGIFGVIVFWPF